MNPKLIKYAEWIVATLLSATVLFVFLSARSTRADSGETNAIFGTRATASLRRRPPQLKIHFLPGPFPDNCMHLHKSFGMADIEMISYPLHLYWSLRALRGQLNPETLDRFQLQYRALYAVIGISMLCSLFYQ